MPEVTTSRPSLFKEREFFLFQTERSYYLLLKEVLYVVFLFVWAEAAVTLDQFQVLKLCLWPSFSPLLWGQLLRLQREEGGGSQQHNKIQCHGKST